MSNGDRNDKQRKRSALLLSALLTTPDEKLEAFRKRRIGADSTIAASSLRDARELLEAVSAAIEDNDDAQWEGIHEACQLLRRAGARPEPPIQDDPTTDVPSVDERLPSVADVGPAAGMADSVAEASRPAISDAGARSSPWASPTSSAAQSDPGEPSAPFGPDPTHQSAPASMTLPVDDVVGHKPRTLPFKMPLDHPPVPPASAPGSAPEAAGSGPGLTAGQSRAAGQAEPDPDPARPPAGATLPIDDGVPHPQATAGEPPDLDVDQYARLCAECAVFPERAQLANQQFGVADAHVRQQLDQQWVERFTQQPELRATWKELLARYKDWFRQGS